MQAVHYIIAILGCGEAEAPCQPVRTLEARYESQAVCTRETEAALASNSDVDYPVIVAQCLAAGATAEGLAPGQVERPGSGSVTTQPQSTPVRS